MKPEGFAAAEVADLFQRIDRSRVDRAGVADDDRRREALPAVRLDGRREQVHPHAEALVRLDLPKLPRPDPEQIHSLVHAVMDLVRGIDRQSRPPFSGESLFPHAGGHGSARRRERREVRHRAPRDENPLGRVRIAQKLRQPAHHAVLHVDRGVIASPAIRIHGGGHVVGRDADGVRGGVDKAEESGMRVAHRKGEDVLAREGERFLDRLPLFGRRLVEERGTGADLPEDGAGDQAGAMVRHRVRGHVAQPPDLLRRQIERRVAHRFIQSFVAGHGVADGQRGYAECSSG